MLVAGLPVASPAEPIALGATVGDGEPHAATARTRAASAAARAATGLRRVASASPIAFGSIGLISWK